MDSATFARWAYAVAALPGSHPGVDANLREQFERQGFFVGQLPPELVQRFLEAMGRSRDVEFRAEDHLTAYVHNPAIGAYLAGLNADHVWKEIDTELRWAISDVLDEIRPAVTSCLGGPWRTLNVRLWKSHSQAQEAAANAWHKDGFPPEVLKIMAYLTEVGAGKGSIEMRLPQGTAVVQGPPGMWLLFRNSDIDHRALAPDPGQPERVALEITLCRSLTASSWPVSAGLNSSYPQHPWYQSLA